MTTNIVPWWWRSKTVPIGKEEHAVASLQRQINRLFNEFASGASRIPDFVSEPLAQLGERLSSFVPNVNVAKTEAALIVTVEAPGMDENDIELSLTREGLTIRGERRPPSVDADEENWLYVESSYGSFERIVPLSELTVDDEKIEASAQKGVVTIIVPLKVGTPSLEKKVRIKSL